MNHENCWGLRGVSNFMQWRLQYFGRIKLPHLAIHSICKSINCYLFHIILFVRAKTGWILLGYSNNRYPGNQMQNNKNWARGNIFCIWSCRKQSIILQFVVLNRMVLRGCLKKHWWNTGTYIWWNNNFISSVTTTKIYSKVCRRLSYNLIAATDKVSIT